MLIHFSLIAKLRIFSSKITEMGLARLCNCTVTYIAIVGLCDVDPNAHESESLCYIRIWLWEIFCY